MLLSMTILNKFEGNSCTIADLSGSTGQPYKPGPKTEKGDPRGNDCIEKCLLKLGQSVPNAKSAFGRETDLCTAIPLPKLKERNLKPRQAGCKPYSLIFGRGTMERPGVGMLGAPLSSSLGSEWHTEAVSYDANLAGINCIGLPGGTKCVGQLNALAQRCPETKIIAGGYSQGAMVSRICVAYASEQAKKQVKVSLRDPYRPV
jgi:hypothetical protein